MGVTNGEELMRYVVMVSERFNGGTQNVHVSTISALDVSALYITEACGVEWSP